MIEAKQLSKSYGDHLALRNLDIYIGPGEIFALLGQNGAGKTTTINCFLGFVSPSSGDALIAGASVKDNPQESKKMLAYIPETVMLYPNLTGIENLAFFSSLAGFTYSEDQLKSFLSKAGLQTLAHTQRVGGFSKGMRQKVGIAIALAKKAKALFLDEPTSGLDPKASNEFSEILTELSAEGTAILMATHDIFRAKEVAHRVGIMKEGQLVSQLSANDLSANELEKLYLQTI
ncbi:ABC-2 type transport system ATP-binding protein [Algoriphagus aquaeductus]|uniref:ABC-2 type transport system ATP-binding protein n=1 Tax=Algoriphagus aquaeductus TaxID=475299 RepID=A0A326RMN1_9BACT|nr:ABC transporter ATP-binding protein [Algoriphagus aquaeductus]PZV79699.1 ABC-2 type transport system ATP-binding protein [Algoriphagus aquaeductus]